MNYLLDENIPPHLIRAISALHARDYPDEQVVSTHDRQINRVDDMDWIPLLNQSGEQWTIVGRDLFRRERGFLQGGNLTWFVLRPGWAHFPFWILSWKLVRTWPEIVRASQLSTGQIFTVAVSGRVAQLV